MQDKNKNVTSVTVAGKEYSISSSESEEYIYAVSLLLNRKIEELRKTQLHINLDNLIVLAALNIADELLKERDRSAELMRRLAEAGLAPTEEAEPEDGVEPLPAYIKGDAFL